MKKSLTLILCLLLLTACSQNDGTQQTLDSQTHQSVNTQTNIFTVPPDFTPAPIVNEELPNDPKPPAGAPPVVSLDSTPLSDLSVLKGSYGTASTKALMTFSYNGSIAELSYYRDGKAVTSSGTLKATASTLLIGDKEYRYALFGEYLLVEADGRSYILQNGNQISTALMKMLSGSYSGDGMTLSANGDQLNLTVVGNTSINGVWRIASDGTVCLTPSESVNLAASAKVSTSSDENADRTGGNAIDQNNTTRWSSSYDDNQWILLDLGKEEKIGCIRIYWETAAGRDYNLLISSDGENWTTVSEVRSNTESETTLTYTFPQKSARYVKMDGHTRTTQYGFSIYEFEVYSSGYAEATSFTCENEASGLAVTLNGKTYHLKKGAN